MKDLAAVEEGCEDGCREVPEIMRDWRSGRGKILNIIDCLFIS